MNLFKDGENNFVLKFCYETLGWIADELFLNSGNVRLSGPSGSLIQISVA